MYKVTKMEDWINTHYLTNGIITPKDINPENIARKFNCMMISYRPMPARYDIFGGYKNLLLDSRLTKKEINEQFFRLLYFVMCCRGHQTTLPNEKIQEFYKKSLDFTMYATLPYFLIEQYDMSNPNIYKKLSKDFVVTEELCVRRVVSVREQTSAGSMKP